MIRSEQGEIEFVGERSELMADLSCLLKGSRKLFGDEFVDACVNLSKAETEDLGEMTDVLNAGIDEIDKQLRLMAMAGAISQLPEEEKERLRNKIRE